MYSDSTCKKIEYIDLHSHTWNSFCGFDKMRYLVDQAIKNGTDVLGITDHNASIGEEGYFMQQYWADVNQMKYIYRGKIKILLGLEVCTKADKFMKDNSCIDDFDYFLLEHPDARDSLVGAKLIEYKNTFKPKWCGLAHLDLFEFIDNYIHKDPLEYLKELAANNIFWEMNVNSDSRNGFKFKHEYVEKFRNSKEQQDIVRKSGMKLSVGFDSHKAVDYSGEIIHEMCNFICENGFELVDIESKMYG